MNAPTRTTLGAAVLALALAHGAAVQASELATKGRTGDLTGTSISGSRWTLPVDDPTWCFGENDLGQCVLFYGSRNACENTVPCTDRSSPSRRELTAKVGTIAFDDDLTFCWGMDEVTNQCVLYLGSKKSCDHVTPCTARFKSLD